MTVYLVVGDGEEWGRRQQQQHNGGSPGRVQKARCLAVGTVPGSLGDAAAPSGALAVNPMGLLPGAPRPRRVSRRCHVVPAVEAALQPLSAAEPAGPDKTAPGMGEGNVIVLSFAANTAKPGRA